MLCPQGLSGGCRDRPLGVPEQNRKPSGQMLFSEALKHASCSFPHRLSMTIFFPSQMTPAHLIQLHPHPRYTKPIHYPIQMCRGDYLFYKFSPVPQPYMQTFEKEPLKL